MKILRTVSLLGLFGLALTACDENPIAEDRESVTRILVNPVFITLTVGGEKKVNGYAINQYGEQTFDEVTTTPCDARVAVRPDTTRLPIEPPAKIIARGVTVGNSCIVFSTGNLRDTVTVRVQ